MKLVHSFAVLRITGWQAIQVCMRLRGFQDFLALKLGQIWGNWMVRRQEMSLFWKHMQGGKYSLNARCWRRFVARMLALCLNFSDWNQGGASGPVVLCPSPSLERPTCVSLRATQSQCPVLVCLWRGWTLDVCKLTAQSLAVCTLLAISWLYLAFSSVFGFPDETRFCGRHQGWLCLGDQRPYGLPGWAVVGAETQAWGQQGYDGSWGSVPVVLGTSSCGDGTWENGGILVHPGKNTFMSSQAAGNLLDLEETSLLCGQECSWFGGVILFGKRIWEMQVTVGETLNHATIYIQFEIIIEYHINETRKQSNQRGNMC